MGDPLTDPARLEPIGFLRIAMDVMASRVYRWVTAAGAFALFAWVCARPDVWRFAAATTFCVLVHVPSWWSDRKRR